MKAFFISCCLILFTLPVTAQVTESHITIEKKSSSRISITETELKIYKEKFLNRDIQVNSESLIPKNPKNKLTISETELKAFVNGFISFEETEDKNLNRKPITTIPEIVDFFQKSNIE